MRSFTNLYPMEAKSVSQLPQGAAWRYEPKWDGFRCLALKRGGKVLLRSKSGKPLERYFPDIVERLQKLKADRFLLDGELLVETGDGFSFAELQLRLHPAASRVQKLAARNPASFMIFDLLMNAEGEDLMQQPLSQRRKELEGFFRTYAARQPRILLSPQAKSLKEAQGWIDELGGYIDGLIAKNGDDIYHPGERQMQKYKFIRTADCVVGGFRYGSSNRLVGSLLLGLYDEDGLLHHVGFTSNISTAEKPAITKKLEKLIRPPGFTGNAPGAPSRWSTERSTAWEPLRPELVVEISYDHVTDHRFRHGTRLIRWRPDKAAVQCTMEQLRQPKILPMQEAG